MCIETILKYFIVCFIDNSKDKEGEGDISQFDITKLKLGLSDTLNDIVSLKHAIQIARLNLGALIDKELKPGSDIVKTEIMPVPFSYSSFDVYLDFFFVIYITLIFFTF